MEAGYAEVFGDDDLTLRVLRDGRLSVQYEPLPVQARTIAAVLYPDRNKASEATDERWRIAGGAFL